MNIALIGSGTRAEGIRRLLESGGNHVAYADESAGGIPYKAATGSRMLVFAAPRSHMDGLANRVGRILPETIVVDAFEAEGEPQPSGQSGAEKLARKLDSHHVVRASILLPVPNANVPLAGDDRAAVHLVEEVLHACGCVTTDHGSLAHAAEIEAPTAGVTA